MEKICESCGMPITKIEYFGGKNPKNKYCTYCTYPDGNLKTYKEKVKDLKNFIMKTTDITENEALIATKENLKKFPAWKNVSEEEYNSI